MKTIITEDGKNSWESLLGKKVTLFCCRYIYTGKLIGIDEDSLLIEDAGIVYETGELTSKDWEDMQKLPNNWYVTKASVESFGILK